MNATWRIVEADCVEAMRAMPEASVDAVVCDPPYGLEFMGKDWDRLANVRAGNPFDPSKAINKDSGAEPRAKDNPWQKEASGYGAPKKIPKCAKCGKWQYNGHKPSQCSCAAPRWVVDTASYPRKMQEWHEAWAREALRVLKPGGHLLAFGGTRTYHRLACAVEDAGFEVRDCLAWLYGSGFPKSHNLNGDWQGWGTALKPSHEPIVLARKPLSGTVAANVLAYGTGALNVDGCRIDGAKGDGNWKGKAKPGYDGGWQAAENDENPAGRWPANVVMDEQAAELLDAQTGNVSVNPAGSFGDRSAERGSGYGMGEGRVFGYGDSGGASRFLYVAKASSAERNLGLDGFETREQPAAWGDIGPVDGNPRKVDTGHVQRTRNTHPTVKPVELMRWLVRLITPPGGTILDPFTGSGTTGIAALREGFTFIGIEREPEYVAIARARIIGDAPLLNTVAEAA